MSQFKRGLQSDLRFISSADPCQTHVLIQTWITTRPMFHLKREFSPDPCLSSNTDHNKTRVLSQTCIPAIPTSYPKRRSQQNLHFISSADLSQTRISPQTRKINHICISTQTRACEFRISTIKKNPQGSGFYYN